MSLADNITYFLARHRMDELEFGRRAAGQIRLIDDMRRGAAMSAEIASRVQRFMDDYVPAKSEALAPLRFTPDTVDPVDFRDRESKSLASGGSALLKSRIIAVYDRVARRDGITRDEAAILLNRGPRVLERWRAQQ